MNPKDNDIRRRIEETLGRFGVTTADFERIARYCNLPPALENFDYFCSSLLLPSARAQDFLQGVAKDEASALYKTIEKCVTPDAQAALRLVVKRPKPRLGARQIPFYGHTELHTFASAFAVLTVDRKKKPVLNEIKSVLLAACIANRYANNRKIAQESLKELSLLIRDLSVGNLEVLSFTSFIVPGESLSSLVNKLQTQVSKQEVERQIPREYYSRLLSVASWLLHGRTKAPSNSPPPPPEQKKQKVPTSDQTTSSDRKTKPRQRTVQKHKLATSNVPTKKPQPPAFPGAIYDTAPVGGKGEGSQESILAEGGPPAPAEREPSFRSELNRAHFVRRALTHNNQLLRNHWSFPSRMDLWSLGEAIKQSPTLSVGPPPPSAVVELTVLLMLITGRPTSQIHIVDELPVVLEPCAAYIPWPGRYWYAIPPQPRNRAEPAPDTRELYHSAVPFLRLKLPDRVCRLLAVVRGDWSSEQFQRHISSEIDKWLSGINDASGTRLSTGHVENALLSCAISICNDNAELALITGSHFVSRHAGIYYLFADCNRLSATYQSALELLVRGTGLVDLMLSGDPDVQQGGIGSNVVPLDKHIIELLTFLTSQLNEHSSRARSLERIVKFHNLYTMYVWIALACGTGCRPIENPICRLADLDLRLGQILLSDKDEQDAMSTRLVGLAPSLRTQLDFYFKHIEALNRRLKSKHGAVITKWNLQHTPLFFLDEETFEQVPVRPSSTKPYIPMNRRLVDNAFRHWFRTSLWQENCPGELIDAALGHWRIGQNPYDPVSSIHRARIAVDQSQYIERVLKKIAFEPRRGFYG